MTTTNNSGTGVPKPTIPINKIKRFEEFYRLFHDRPSEFKYREAINRIYAEGGNTLEFLYEDLNYFDEALAKLLRNDPEEMLPDAIEAFKNLLKLNAPGGKLKVQQEYYVRILTKNDSLLVNLRDICSAHIGKMIFTKGMITRISMPQSKIEHAEFKCLKCGAQIPVKQIIKSSDKMLWPKKCIRPKCGAKAQKDFEIITNLSEFIDWQKITIQELPESANNAAVPRTLDAILKNNLVDSIRSGARVQIMCQYRSRPRTMKTNQKSTIFYSFLDVISIESLDDEFENLEASREDVKSIIELSRAGSIHEKISDSIAPSLYGYNDLKMAAALSLFGGTRTIKASGAERRSNIHVLFIGDPGLGKTDLVKSAIDLSPRGLYVSGKGASAVGLTAALVKDEMGSLVLEPGALVLTDGDMCGIDELDKMSKSNHHALHESLESGTVSIAKAGIIRTLNARATAIAAANPYYGRYNKYKTPTENIRLEASLLSRFDLIFVVIDEPNPAQDEKIVDFILEQATGSVKNAIPIKREFLKKYIYYARKNCHPILSPEAKEKIRAVYLGYRKKSNKEQGIVSIVARQAECLIRLSEAYAKMALRDTVSSSDVGEVLKLFERSLRDVGYDEDTQSIDVDRIFSGQTRSKINKIEKIIEITRQFIDDNGKSVEISDLYDRLMLEGFAEKFIADAIDNAVKEGTLYKPRNNLINYAKR